MSLSSLSSNTDSHSHFLYYLSKSSSVISLTMWLFAQIPQIILNYRHQKVTLSVPFLLMVTISDLVNLGYQAVVKDHTYLILLSYSSILNVVIIAQYVYYAKYPKKPPTPQVEPPTLVNRILGSAFMVSPASCMTLNYQKTNDTRMRFTLRESLSFSSSILYILSRVPQIQKNYRRKSTNGLSLYMIFLMFFGNIFNLVSIASDPHLLKIYSHDTYLIGSLGTIVMDFVILCQFWKYKKINRVSRRDSEFTDIDEHPQWYVKNQPLVLYQPEFQQATPAKQPPPTARPPPVPPSHRNGSANSTTTRSINPSRGRRPVKSPGEQTLLLSDSLTQFTTPPPPQHYIVSSSVRYQLTSTGSTSHFPKAIPKSLTSSSVGSATSFIPSIIGNISSVNKKLLDGSKVPFSPIDFLADEFYNKSPGVKESNGGSASHNAGYYGSVDI